MKIVISILVVLSSIVAFAGPEDHIQEQRCYNLTAKDPHAVSKLVPRQICLETVSLDPTAEKLSIYSYFSPELYQNLKTFLVIRSTEDRYDFMASNQIYAKFDSVCGPGQTVELFIKGQSDVFGAVNNEALTITTQYSYTYDTCHSEPQTTEYTYQFIR